MFTDINLKAFDEADMIAALLAAGFVNDESGRLCHAESTLLLLPEGMITRPTGEVQTVDGIELEVREPVPGYHANVRTTSQDVADALVDLRIYPVTPVCVWA